MHDIERAKYLIDKLKQSPIFAYYLITILYYRY